ncbi:MAG: HVO_0476 family zinc finger protein [Methanoculleaceae archaeon]
MEVICPGCNSKTPHEVLHEAGDVLVRCTVCGGVHRVPKGRLPHFVEVPIVVSRHEESMICVSELLSDEVCHVGDMMVAFCNGEPVAVEITGIETGSKRVQSAETPEIRTLWSREVEKVVLRVSVHEGARTYPVNILCDGETPVTVGEVRDFEGLRGRVTRIKLRNGALLKREGQSAPAMRIKRVFSDRVRR